MIIALWMVSARLPSVLLFIPGVLVAFIISIRYYNKITDPDESLLTWYLIALAIQFLHFTEEYLTDFVTRLPALLGQDAYPMEFWVSFNMIAYSVFIFGGIVFYKKLKACSIVPIFFIVVGVIFNGIAHLLLSIYTVGYFPGLFTAILYVMMIPIFIKKIANG